MWGTDMIANVLFSQYFWSNVLEAKKKSKHFQVYAKCEGVYTVQRPFFNNIYVPFLSYNLKLIILKLPVKIIAFSIKCSLANILPNYS